MFAPSKERIDADTSTDLGDFGGTDGDGLWGRE